MPLPASRSALRAALLCLALLAALNPVRAQGQAPAASPRQVFNLNQGWEFFRPNDGAGFAPPKGLSTR